MEGYGIRSKSLHVSLQVLFVVARALAEPTFKIEPMETTALEGSNVTIYCVIDHLQPDIHEVRWHRGRIQVSRDANVIVSEPRLRVETDPGRGEYNLMINRVILGDDTDYSCQVIDKTADLEVLESDAVRLEVHHVPPAQYPSCFPLTKDTYQAGEVVTITCQSERGNPPVTLLWTHEGEPLPIHADDTQNGFRNIDYTFTVGPANHRNIFQCKLSTSATNLVRRSCSLGPLDVIFPPTSARIEGSANVAHEQEVELACTSEANPPPSYIWTFSDGMDQSRIAYSDGNQRMTFTATLADSGLIIGCNATNNLGTARDAITLGVHPAMTKPIYGTTPSRKMTPDHGEDTGGAPSKPQTDPSGDNIILKPEVLAIIASTLTLILLVLVVLVVVTCRCRPKNPKTVTQMPQMIYGQYGPSSVQGWEQGSIYFEPRDRISVRDMPTWQRPAPWHRNVAVQVPWVEEPPYEEIGQTWDEGMTLEI